MDRCERAYVGLGANVGGAWSSLEHAVHALRSSPGWSLAGVSRLYRTRPVGPVEQVDFLDAVVGLDVPATADPDDGAMDLLRRLKRLERESGRRERERWGPRELDLDLLVYGPHRIHIERPAEARSEDPARSDAQWLDVPHPSAAERLFVLAPLADLAPHLRPSGWRMSVELARRRAEVAEGAEAVGVVAAWDEETGRWLSGAGSSRT